MGEPGITSEYANLPCEESDTVTTRPLPTQPKRGLWFALRGPRARLAAWLLGDDWWGVMMRLWLIRDRALACITEDGHVILAECEPLATALYAPIPGRWALTVTRVDIPSGDPT